MPELMTGLSVIGGVSSLISGGKSAKAASQNADAASYAAMRQADLAEKGDARTQEAWDRYKKLYWPQEEAALDRYNNVTIPLEDEMIDRWRDVYRPLEDEEIARYRDVYRPLEDERIARERDVYRPLEDQFIETARAGVTDRSEEIATDAADTTASAFDNAQAMNRRSMDRYNVGATAAMDRNLSIGRAAAVSDAKNDARRDERYRVEDTNFGRLQNAVAMTRGQQVNGGAPSVPNSAPRPGAGPTMSAPGQSNAASQMGSNAGIYAQLASMMSRDAANAGYGGMAMLRTGMDYLGKNNPWSTPPFNPNAGAPSYDYSHDGTNLEYREGGVVVAPHKRVPYEQGGAVNGPSHASGGVPIEAEGGEYIIPKDVVADVGIAELDALIQKSRARATERAQRGHKAPGRRA